MRTPVSPPEWYETGVLLRREERFGEAINAFARAAELASEEIAGIRTSLSGGAVSSECNAFQENEDRISELENIKISSLAFIDLIRDINAFVNTDIMNP